VPDNRRKDHTVNKRSTDQITPIDGDLDWFAFKFPKSDMKPGDIYFPGQVVFLDKLINSGFKLRPAFTDFLLQVTKEIPNLISHMVILLLFC
jgi:hypothetical protein